MKRGEQGSYSRSTAGGETVRSYLPRPLPPDPPIELGAPLQQLMERANRALGRLDGLGSLLPDRNLFLYAYVRKEALISSQIEGTQSSLSDLLLHERGGVPGVPLGDVEEVSQYVAALQYGLDQIRTDRPITLRLLREIHEILLSQGRGSEKTPGEFRRSPVWLGGTRPGNAIFVPPPAPDVIGCMGDLEKFIHDIPTPTPTLLKAALAHVQFETIHPFLDGNGRLGRMLITLLLCAEDAISEPLLYLSLYLKTHRQRYYELLQSVRISGDWEEWLLFFLEGVVQISESGASTARRILSLFGEDRARIRSARGKTSALHVHDALRQRVMGTIGDLAQISGLSVPTVTTACLSLQRLGILTEVTGRRRDRLFVYQRYLDLLSEGAEPLPRSAV